MSGHLADGFEVSKFWLLDLGGCDVETLFVDWRKDLNIFCLISLYFCLYGGLGGWRRRHRYLCWYEILGLLFFLLFLDGCHEFSDDIDKHFVLDRLI